jgi:hypothetical protein
MLIVYGRSCRQGGGPRILQWFFLKGAKTVGEDPTVILLMMVGGNYNMYKDGSKWNPKDKIKNKTRGLSNLF